jgi:hypothetical protein
MPNPRPSADYIKTCSRCREAKTAENFHSAPNCRDGLQSRCKGCQNAVNADWARRNPEKKSAAHTDWVERNRAHVNAAQRGRYKKDPERFKDYERRQNYGLEPGQYAAMLAAQGHRCAICGTAEPGKRGFHVDHCHQTRIVRGILCHHCNLLIGHAKESEVILGSAIEYLKSTQR